MRAFLIRWFVTAVAVLTAAHIVPGIEYNTWVALLIASLVLGLINATLKPFLLILSLPLLLMTFGLFILVINSALLWTVGYLVDGFNVHGFWSALGGSIIISIVTFFLKNLSSNPPQDPPPRQRKPSSIVSSHDKVIDV